MPQDAYVWQRVWTPALGDALRRTTPLVAGFRVLVAEWSPDGGLARPGIDWAMLHGLRRPVVAVLRIDGRRRLPAPDAIRSVLASLPAGASPVGVEIDYDCPTARLETYRRFLLALRPDLPAGVRLSITSLPDWLHAEQFPRLSRSVDQLVLQVHAADDPRQGLFDPASLQSQAWQMARLSSRPFLVALPAYGVRVVLAGGRLLATEAERPALFGSAGTELDAAPARVLEAVRRLEDDPPHRLAGLAWFRVPTASDTRSWSASAWQSVLERRDPAPDLWLRPVAAGPAGLQILRLANEGALDAELPDRIALPSLCAAADGAGPYRLQQDAAMPGLERNDGGLLPAHAAITIGWARCALAARRLTP